MAIQGPSQGIYQAHGSHQAQVSNDMKINEVRAQCFSVETHAKESEIELRAQIKQLREAQRRLIVTLEQASLSGPGSRAGHTSHPTMIQQTHQPSFYITNSLKQPSTERQSPAQQKPAS